jgi:hypothetical protein
MTCRAFIRRARRVQEAFEQLLARCRRQRQEWLDLVGIHLGMLRGLAGEWRNLDPILADAEKVDALRQLDQELKPRLRLPVRPTTSLRALRRAVDELRQSIERFNLRWRNFLREVDLSCVNDLRS